MSDSDSRSRIAAAVLLAWLLSVGFDAFLHGALLHEAYLVDDPFLLPPELAFRRIPIGYAAFLVLTAALAWLLVRVDVRGARPGARLGGVGGAIVWGGLALGLYSITTASTSLLVGWWVGQSVELALAGAVLGSVRAGTPLRRVALIVGGAVVALLATTVVLQSTGVVASGVPQPS